MRAVVFGAGSIGRGFVGAMLSRSGWLVTFIDVVQPLITRLDADGGYNQIIVDGDEERIVRIEPVNAILLSDTDRVTQALTEADLAATAVGQSNLGTVASHLADAVRSRRQHGRPALNVLLCENVHDAPTFVMKMISEELGSDSAASIGLLETSIGCMVPTPKPTSGDPTGVRVEPYAFLPYDVSALIGDPPDVLGLVAIEDGFALFGDRKLYIHNMGHCLLANLATIRGHEYIWQAMGDLDLRWLVRGAMVETATALATIHGVPAGPLLCHVDDLLSRFCNRQLADTTERVGRDPARKMGPEDRVLGSLNLCRQAGVTPSYVSLAVAAGSLRLALEDGWSDELVLQHVDRYLFDKNPEPRLRRLLQQQMDSLREGVDAHSLVRLIDQTYRPSRIL